MHLPLRRARDFYIMDDGREASRCFSSGIANHEMEAPAAGVPARAAGSEWPDKNPAIGEKIHPVKIFINAHYTNHISRETLAAVSGLNPDYLCRQFKLRFGKTPMEYLGEVRVREAARRLADGGVRVVDVALEVGFESLRSFNRNFRRVMGHSPRCHRGIVGMV